MERLQLIGPKQTEPATICFSHLPSLRILEVGTGGHLFTLYLRAYTREIPLLRSLPYEFLLVSLGSYRYHPIAEARKTRHTQSAITIYPPEMKP